jgi:predicted CXXCH cytochrome family protein
VKRPLAIFLMWVSFCAQAAGQAGSIKALHNSRHDFSTSSGTTIKSSKEDATCLFCHTPHNAQPAAPLWNHQLSKGLTYQVYQSTTTTATVQQPQSTDYSKLCLSCHDGTVALGDTVNNGQIPFRNVPGNQMLSSSDVSNFGTNLSSHHPIAFTVETSNPQFHVPPRGDAVQLDNKNRLQCTSCHDAHDESIDPVENRFLVKNNSGSAICTTCHDLKGGTGANQWSWSGDQGLPSSHKTAANTYNTQTNGGITRLGAHSGYTTTSTNGCEACHRPHTAYQAAQLLKGETDQTCFQCHDGNPLTQLPDIKSEYTRKIYVHPSVGPQAGHDPAEAPQNILTRHAACDDCHNPHAAHSDTTPPAPPQMLASLLGVSGIAADGSPHDSRRSTGDALYEYETCFKCHSYNFNKPQVPGYQTYGPLPNRQGPFTDLRQAFSSGASWHPVTRPRGLSGGPGGAVPSLLPALVDGAGAPMPGRTLSGASQIYCVDCHSSDTGRTLGGGNTDPAGPHGSNVIHILERSYVIESAMGTPGMTPNIPYASSNYELCFKCHSEQSLRNNNSFKYHSQHMQIASCATCHDPHGVPSGTTSNGSLINFDRNIVAPNSLGVGPNWMDLTPAPGSTTFHGSCNLRCHGQDHNNIRY